MYAPSLGTKYCPAVTSPDLEGREGGVDRVADQGHGQGLEPAQLYRGAEAGERTDETTARGRSDGATCCGHTPCLKLGERDRKVVESSG